MHVFGVIACSSTLEELKDVITSAAVVFGSPCSGKHVNKHSKNLEVLIEKKGTMDLDKEHFVSEDYKVITISYENCA